MRAEDVQALLEELALDDVVAASYAEFFYQALAEVQAAQPVAREREADAVDPFHLALAIERLAMQADDDGGARRHLFDQAFICRRSIAGAELSHRSAILHYALLAADGLIAQRHAELVMLLREVDFHAVFALPDGLEWPDELLLRVARSFILLSRKSNGWDDVRAAVAEIESLRHLQQEREAAYVDRDDASAELLAALLARYNLAKIVEIATSFTIQGEPAEPLIPARRHKANIDSLLELHPDPELTHLADLLFGAVGVLVSASIWSYARRGLGARVDAFIDQLVNHRREPILELWPSQQTALSSSLLDPARRAIVVEMPTSAGKTLLAEFAIVQAVALYPDRHVAYVVPTRALVNQITRRLRADLSRLGITVEAAIPVFELDPTEDALLRQPFNVLVLTPEKLDLLVRSDHPAVAELSLVVADEAHTIGGDERGARLELLLATVRRERAGTRFLLLTPFVPNGEELAQWLGGEGAEATIQIDWKPGERATTTAVWRKPRNQPHHLHLKTLPSAHHVDLTAEVTIDLGEAGLDRAPSLAAISGSAAIKLARRGAVLVLARGQGTAETRASEIASVMPERDLSDLGRSVLHFAEAELGADHPLPQHLKRGVAFHHAGISHDLRYLIEILIDEGDVDVVCGTPTLAQGVNFPIASVIMETLQKPAGVRAGWSDFTYSEFWNIAGRAGRALRDRLGLVVFPVRNAQEEQRVRAFLAAEATEVASVLIESLAAAADVAGEFNLAFIRRHRSFSVFLQYLMHALRVAGFDSAIAQLQDLLRASLVYHQLERDDARSAEELVRIASEYLTRIRGKDPGYLALADGTGFSLASVDYLYARHQQEHPEFATREFWSPDGLLGEGSTQLVDVVRLLADVPEISLARTDAGPFNPEAVAGIISDWVAGLTASEIADRWFSNVVEDPETRRRVASRYLHSTLVGQIPWGLGALQKLALRDADALAEVGHVPSLVFYGVHTREAALLRMGGVPRVAAEGLADRWRDQSKTATSFADLRSWLSELEPSDWGEALPREAPLTGSECRRIWEVIGGVTGR